jgi:hypothetical protein
MLKFCFDETAAPPAWLGISPCLHCQELGHGEPCGFILKASESAQFVRDLVAELPVMTCASRGFPQTRDECRMVDTGHAPYFLSLNSFSSLDAKPVAHAPHPTALQWLLGFIFVLATEGGTCPTC